MARFTIYSKDGQIKRYEGEPQYSGSYMGVDFVEFRTISSPTPIDWQIGDYVDYYRTGKRYKLYSLPMPKKVARKGEYGASFEYSNVQLYGATKELEIAPFRDLVTKDNKIHFSTRPDVSTYEDVYGVARRIQECMDDLYPNKWRIEVYNTDDADLLALLGETKEYSVSGGNCLNALSQIYDTWKNVGWIHTYDSANGVDVITIGRANVRNEDNTSDSFAYGVGKGLTSIKKASANKDEFATRLYIYGSERNIQTRYYNGLDILNKDSVDIRNLMLPIEKWGKTNGLPDASKAYLQADDSIIEKYGIIPRTVYFDGSKNEEIYPSIKGLTMWRVRQAMIDAGQGDSEYLPGNYDYRIDEIALMTSALDSGSKEDTEKNMTFVVGLHEMGFNLAEQGKLTSEGFATIHMKSGACAGRDFKVKRYNGPSYGNAEYGDRTYTIERNWDESIGMGFPNKTYPIKPGDEFVLLDIPMPDYYITLAANRLLEAGEKMLSDYTRVSAFYEPSVDAIKIKAGGKLLQAGMFMQVYDEDIIDTADNKDYVLIDTLTIDEKIDLPIYKVTLREQKRSAKTYSALEDMIEDAKETNKQEINRVRQYTDRRFRSAQETLEMLQAAFSNFSDGISPVTIRTMSMLVGDESLQFKFTAASNSLTDIACPFSYDETTKQMKSMVSYLKHMTLGIKTITTETMSAPSYKTWHIPAWASAVLDDGAKRYYVYVKASKSDSTSECLLSETPIGMEDVSGYYHFLVGILNSEYDGKRDFITLYGFTEVLPGQITTDVLRSANSNLIIDLLNAKISAKNGATIEGKMTFQSGSSGLENLSEWSGKQTQIDTAVTNASAANSKADNAQSTANSANETAKDAQSTANNAQSTADNAQASADNALSRVETTKKELEESIQDAEKAANSYTDEGKAALQASIDALNEAKANISEVYTKTEADGVTNSAEQRAKDAAQGYASAAQSAAETNAKAYADGVADDAEKAAIADAESKLAAAKQELEQAITEVEDIANAVDAANKALDTKISDIETGVNESVAEINKRLDGVVENYFEEGAPSLTKKPVTDWIDASKEDDYELINHVGDTYTNIEEYVDDATTPDAGKSWRWCWCDDSSITNKIEVTDKDGVKRYLHWHPIADSDAVKALLEASKAQTAADGKSKNFVNEPTPPYKEGDLWIQGPNGDTWRCKDGVNRTSGSYDASEWELASKYTDDTKANEAKDAADNAQETADNAKGIAQNAKLFTDSLNNDSILTEVEKREIRRLMSEITECTGSAVASYNAKITRIAQYGNAWYLVNDKSFAQWTEGTTVNKVSQKDWDGYYSSNMHTHGGYTKTRLGITVARAFNLKLRFGSDAQTTLDYLNVGAVGVVVAPSSTVNDLTDATKQASTSGKQGIANVMTKTFSFPEVASTYIELSYKKNASTSVGTDSGYYRILNNSYMGVDGNEYIVEMSGSFHRYYLTLMRNGYTAEATKLKARLDALMSFLNTYGLWTSGNTTSIPATFRASLNDLVAKYYAYAVEVGFDISMNRTNDMQYLANAMKKGRTIIDGGLVMSSMVAVADTESASDADVKAFLNGSDFARDSEVDPHTDAACGKLILAAGIPESATSGGETLEARSQKASTRIYEDGCVYTKKLFLQDGCAIGNIKVDNNGILVRSDIDNSVYSVTSLDDSYGLISERRGEYGNNYGIRLGGQCDGVALRIGYGAGFFMQNCLVKKAALYVECSVDEVPAICIFNGMFEGLRPKVRTITSSSPSYDCELTRYDHTIIVNAAGQTISLTLPDSPQEGQRYEIYVCHATTDLWVDSGSVNVYNFIDATDVKGNLHFGSGRRYHIELFFCGQWWLNYRYLY